MKISHTNNDNSKNPFDYLLIIDISIWSLQDCTNRCATLVTNRRMHACVTLFHSLCTAARSSAVCLDNGFIPLVRLDIHDQCSQWYWYPGPLLVTGGSGHQSPHWQETPRLSWLYRVKHHPAWRQLYPPMHDYQCVAYHEAWGCDQYTSVQLGLRECQLSPVCSHCWHISLRGLSLRGRSFTSSCSLGLTACRLKMPYTALCGIPMHIEIAGALVPVEGNNTPTSPYCCAGHFRAISILLHVLTSHTHRRF